MNTTDTPTKGTIQRFGETNRIDSAAAVPKSVTNVADISRLPINVWLRPVSTSTAYTTARLVVESAIPAILAASADEPRPQYANAIATRNGARKDTPPNERLAFHSRRSCRDVDLRSGEKR